MNLRILLAIPDPQTQALFDDCLDAALRLVRHDLAVGRVDSRESLLGRVAAARDDVVFLDWDLAGRNTPDLVRALVCANPQVRTVVLLPLQLRQYRQIIWDAGACSSIPTEYLDQEWVSSALCLITRAMQREARAADRARATTSATAPATGGPVASMK